MSSPVDQTAASPALLETLAALHATAFPSPWGVGEFADLLEQAGVHALVEQDGFILIRVVLDEAEILTVAVHPKARRSGIGRRLVQAAALSAQQAGATRVFLEVAENNGPALALYERTGFGPVGRRKGYYDGGRTDAVVMALELSARP